MVRWLACFFLLVVPLVSGTCASVAVLASLEGDVSVIRGGTLIPSENVAEGFALEDFDTVTTGRTGRADIRFAASTGIGGTVRLDADTALYVDATPLKKEQTVGIELLVGGVTVQVASALGTSTVEVRTDSGTFSQTGPGFRALMAESGETLVWTRAGQVVCRVGNRVVSTEPGIAVEASSGVRTIPVNVSTLDAFEAGWLAAKKQTVRDQASAMFREVASRYLLEVGRFQRAWDRGQREAVGPAKANEAATADLRRSAAPLERSIPRLKVLRRLFDEGLIPPTLELSRGYAAKEFFKAWDQEAGDWAGRLAQARGRYKTVVESSGGEFPRTKDLPEVTFGSDFFH
jgi:hypothetical protein